MDINSFKTSEIEDSGKWFDLGDGARVKLRATSFKPFRAAIKLAMKPHLGQKRMGILDAEVEEKIFANSMADHIVLGWENFEEGGKELKFNRVNSHRILSSTRLGVHFANLASDLDSFNAELEEEGIENVKKS